MVKYSDFTSEKFMEIQARMKKAVDNVKPIEECKEFMSKLK